MRRSNLNESIIASCVSFRLPFKKSTEKKCSNIPIRRTFPRLRQTSDRTTTLSERYWWLSLEGYGGLGDLGNLARFPGPPKKKIQQLDSSSPIRTKTDIISDMPESSSSLSQPMKIVIKLVVNVLLVWSMYRFLPQYFAVHGGLPAYIIIGSLLTLMNMFLRPLLSIITFPLHLLFTLATTIAVNAFFLFVIYEISLKMDPNVVTLAIKGGLSGWLIVSLLFGVGNWFMKHVF